MGQAGSPGAVPPDVLCAADYERHARERLDPAIWGYIAGSGADGLTRRWNREALDNLRLSGRVLADMGGASTASTLLGQHLDLPLLIAPVAYHRLVHPDGELATIAAAAACSVWMTVSTQASIPLEDIAQTAQTPLWFQLYVQPDRDATLGLVKRAEDAGYKALVVTLDATVSGVRNEEQRAGFRLPPGVRAVNLEGIAGPVSNAGPCESPVFKGFLDGAPTWEDIAWLRSETTLPLLLKGVMHPDDAERAVDAGADGIIVSNHGGRTLDTLPATVDALRPVAERLRGRAPLLADGGVRRGTDILKFLALGADAVLIGQPVMHALAVAGPVGVAHLLTILRAEFEVAMTLTGCRTIADIGPGVLFSVET